MKISAGYGHPMFQPYSVFALKKQIQEYSFANFCAIWASEFFTEFAVKTTIYEHVLLILQIK